MTKMNTIKQANFAAKFFPEFKIITNLVPTWFHENWKHAIVPKIYNFVAI